MLTTVEFIMLGAKEGNPVVRFFMTNADHPISGLVIVKVIAIAMAVYCWRSKKMSLLMKANLAFATLITWNMVAILLSLAKA